MYTNKKPRGQALALIMVAIFGILALTALAIDGGNAFGDKRKAQSAADNAAVAAALALTDNNSSTVYTTEALTITQANSRLDETVTVSWPPGAGCDGSAFSTAGLYDTTLSHYVQVMIQSTVPTFFGPVIGIDTVSHCVEAVARAKPVEPGNAFPGTAIVALNCLEDRTFDAYGGGVLHVEDGGIYVNSNDPDDALYSGGTSEVRSPSYTVVGGDNGGNFYNEDGSGPGVITSGVLPYPCPSTISYNIPACTSQSQKDGTYTF
ncbi:MAG: pilus assembly protein TadG-related protein, partial [Candidatus Methanomethylicus sp.]|nr:pilus assembly protein TadG-related protein [Candidatus Methanomethylicus sp.]